MAPAADEAGNGRRRRVVLAAIAAAAAAGALLVAGCGGGDADREAGSPAGPIAFVNMLASDRYEIGRYRRGVPDPAGAVAGSDCGLWSPSAFRARDRFWLYAAESDCRGWRRIVLFESEDGVEFERRAEVIRRPPGEGQLRMPYVVFDRGLFRAWYTVDRGARQGQELIYAESRDGVRFRPAPGIRAVAGPERFDAGAITVEVVFRDPVSGRWALLYTGFDPGLRRARPGLMSFADPARGRYRKLGPIGAPRDRRGRLAAAAAAGETRLRVRGGPFRAGDPVVAAAGAEGEPDPAQVATAAGGELTLRMPLRFDHAAGEEIALADAAKVSPSYACRAGRGWRGLFTVFGAPPELNVEYTAAFRAPRLGGPWRPDPAEPFPFLAPENDGFRRSVENPTPVSGDASGPRCGAPGSLLDAG